MEGKNSLTDRDCRYQEAYSAGSLCLVETIVNRFRRLRAINLKTMHEIRSKYRARPLSLFRFQSIFRFRRRSTYQDFQLETLNSLYKAAFSRLLFLFHSQTRFKKRQPPSRVRTLWSEPQKPVTRALPQRRISFALLEYQEPIPKINLVQLLPFSSLNRVPIPRIQSVFHSQFQLSESKVR